VSLYRITSVHLEHADTVQIRMRRFGSIERAIQVSGVCRTIVAFDQLECIWTKSVVRIEVASPALNGIIAGVMCQCFLQTKFVDNSFTLVFDIVKMHTCIAAEGKIELKIHPLDVFLLGVYLIPRTC
jgi:hypothetical protein